MPTTLIDDPQDPQLCEDCVAYGEVCEFHRGYALGWDDAAAIVGQFVTLVPTEPDR
jgi:hypothetical protein